MPVQLLEVPQPGAGAGEQLIPAIRPSGLKFTLIMCSFSHRIKSSGVRLRSLALIFAGKYLEQMEVSVNFLILLGISCQALPDIKRVKSRPCHRVQPDCLKFSNSYLSESTWSLAR